MRVGGAAVDGRPVIIEIRIHYSLGSTWLTDCSCQWRFACDVIVPSVAIWSNLTGNEVAH